MHQVNKAETPLREAGPILRTPGDSPKPPCDLLIDSRGTALKIEATWNAGHAVPLKMQGRHWNYCRYFVLSHQASERMVLQRNVRKPHLPFQKHYKMTVCVCSCSTSISTLLVDCHFHPSCRLPLLPLLCLLQFSLEWLDPLQTSLYSQH